MAVDEIERPASRWKLKRWQWIVLVVLIGAIFRVWAAWQLPIDADEPTYLNAGKAYASLIKAGDLEGIINYQVNQEHPPLVKLMDSLPFLFIEPRFGSTTEMMVDRLISVFWGTLAVLLMSIINPLAGFFLATDSMVVKYTSEVYLEALPSFAILLAVYALQRSLKRPGLNRGCWGSAVAVGAAVAGQYLYGLIGFPLLALFITNKKYRIREVGFYVLAALAVFFLLDPYLWADPINRLSGSLLFHVNYTQGSDVINASYPWFQAFNWITAMVPWHPQVFFFPTPDLVIFLLALVGIIPLVKKNPWIVVWMVSSFLILLAWPTKWPQYTLVLIPALCLAAAVGLEVPVRWAKEFESTWHWGENVLPHPEKWVWILIAVLVAALGFGKVAYEFQQAQVRANWFQVRSEYSPLLSNKVNDIVVEKNGEIGLATDSGVSFWTRSEFSPWGESQVNFTVANSGLADAQVNRLLQDSPTAWWFGTQNGLNYFDPATGWRTYRAQDMGLASGQINAMVKDGQGRLWVGTNAGAAVFDGSHWTTYTHENSGLADNAIFSLAVQSDQAAWFGHLKGVSRLDLKTGSWTTFDISSYGFHWGGTTDLLVDHLGRVWAATTGSGLSMWDGKEWTNYRASNSGIPQNDISRIYEAPDGTLWMGCTYATEPGGLLVHYDGKDWTTYDPSLTGYSGAQVLSLAMDSAGRLWIGTATQGLDIFQTQTGQ